MLAMCNREYKSGLKATFWIDGWACPLRNCIIKAVDPGKSKTVEFTRFFEDPFAQVDRSLEA